MFVEQAIIDWDGTTEISVYRVFSKKALVERSNEIEFKKR